MLDIKKLKKKKSDSAEDCNSHPQWETWDSLYIPKHDKSGRQAASSDRCWL